MRTLLILLGLATVAWAADTKEAKKAAAPADDTTTEEVAPPADEPADSETDEEAEASAESDADDEAALFAELEAAAAAAAKEEREREAKIAAERAAAKGEKHDTFVTTKGRTYQKVTIRSVDDLGVRIMHEAGTARVKFAECPIEMQQRFGYDPGAAKAQAEKERSRGSARTRLALARLRAESGKPPLKKRKVPTTTAPRRTPTTTPREPEPEADTPVNTEDAPDLTEGEVAEDEVLDIPTLQKKIAILEAGIAKLKKIGDEYEKKAKKIEDRAFARNAGSTREPELSPAVLKQVKEWRDKADAEFDKIAKARRLISKHRKAIKKIERAK